MKLFLNPDNQANIFFNLKTIILSTLFFLSFSIIHAQGSIEGVLVSKKGQELIIKVDDLKNLPAKNDSCNLHKDISGTKNPFGITVKSGWLEVADVLYIDQKDKKIRLKIVKETTNIIINGKKQDQFVVGKKMKLDWK